MLRVKVNLWGAAVASTMLAWPQWCAAADPRLDGAKEYRTSCAVCHGSDGHGDGPMAEKLTRRPSDLTVLSKNNGGSFPETVVYQTIDGRRIVLFHGSVTMPIWGERFRSNGEEVAVDARISALVSHVESMQAK